jgi:hypothetical protein
VFGVRTNTTGFLSSRSLIYKLSYAKSAHFLRANFTKSIVTSTSDQLRCLVVRVSDY